MKKIKKSIGYILITLNLSYLIMIMFLDWTVKKEIVLPTVILNAVYVLYMAYIDKENK